MYTGQFLQFFLPSFYLLFVLLPLVVLPTLLIRNSPSPVLDFSVVHSFYLGMSSSLCICTACKYTALSTGTCFSHSHDKIISTFMVFRRESHSYKYSTTSVCFKGAISPCKIFIKFLSILYVDSIINLFLTYYLISLDVHL